MNYAITCGTVEAWAATYDGPPFHAMLCDAPYEIAFMGREWDNSGIAFQAETWAALARHLLPGAFLFVFAGTVNDDLISVAMRQAGLRKHHKALTWSYGSGLQKSTRMDDKIDRRAGAERAVVRERKHAPKFAAAEFGYRQKDNGYNSRERQSFTETAPATAMAQTWAGHRYGLQLLKPAIEPVLVFQKPYAGDALSSITATGAGALWIDGGRVPSDGRPLIASDPKNGRFSGVFREGSQYVGTTDAGRWPANLALVHHPACNGACHPDCAVERLGAQSGERTSGGGSGHRNYADSAVKLRNSAPGFVGGIAPDTGTAARFFYNADWMYERLELADQVGYFAKVGPTEREAGLDPLQVALMAALSGDDASGFAEQTVDDGRKTSIDNPFLRGETARRNTHTTLKPIALARWLATLLLPPVEYGPRRLLIPFAGAGSEVIGAMLAGWEAVQGVELVAEHVRIAQARLRYWQQQRHRFDQGQPIAVKGARKGAQQGPTLFDEPQEAA